MQTKTFISQTLLFHLPIIPLFFPHLLPFLIPKPSIDPLPLSHHLYHIPPLYIPTIFPIITFIPIFLLTPRPLTTKSI
ncbi:respiratory nitrate reductase subunit gamma, partial [Staphylococcus aureus]|uniref:respiratory nitrate reductase subunit gamma n=1 Tax=Staphylococcus aureus TaxID=1280 RepID=UPI0011A04775